MTHTQAQAIAAILHKHGITICPFQDNASVTSVVRLLAASLFTNSFDAGFYASFDVRGFIRDEGYAGTDFQVSEVLAFILVRKDRERSNALERHPH